MQTLKEKNWQLEFELRTLKEEYSNLEEQVTLMSEDIGRYNEEWQKQSAEIQGLKIKNDALDFDVRRLEAANGALQKALDRAVKSKTTAEESDWDILGLVEDSSVDDVHIQYKRMVMMYHPDKYAKLSIANQTKTTERFKRIQNAYKNILAKLKRTAMKMGVPQHELQKYSAHFGDISINGSVLNPYIVSV